MRWVAVLGVTLAVAAACGSGEETREPAPGAMAGGERSSEGGALADAGAPGGGLATSAGAAGERGGGGGSQSAGGGGGDHEPPSEGGGGAGSGRGGAAGDETGGAGPVGPGSLRFDLPVDGLSLPGGFRLTEDLTGDGRREAVYLDPFTTAGSLRVVFAVAQADGAFVEMPALVVGASSAVPAYGDFDGDGRIDVALGDRDQGLPVQRVFLGNGDGTFQPRIPYPGGVLGDFNGDGRTDALAIGGTNVPSSTVWLAQADLSFEEHAVPFVSNARHWAVGDFDGDGNQDILLDLEVRHGGGDGTFGPLVTPASCSPCSNLFDAMTVTDLNDDGCSDVVVGYPFELVVLLGQANGSLVEASRHSLRYAKQIAAGHLDGDGHLDLAVTSDGWRLELLFGDGAGSFAERRSYETSLTAYAPPLVEDHDRDGLGDVVLDGRWVAYGRGQRRIRAPEYSEFTPAGPKAPAIVDRVKGGALDVASALRDEKLHLLPFGSDRYLQPGEVCSGPGTGAEREVADFTGDGLVDVASFTGDLSLWVGQGGCQFAAATPHPYAGVLSWFSKIDEDDLSDVLYWTQGGFGIALATAPGVFAPPVRSPFSHWPYSVAAADFNGDGELDVVTADHEDLVITVLLGKDLVLTEADSFDFSANEEPYLLAADIDGDRDTDVLMGIRDSWPSHIDVLRNDGSATFTRERLADADTNAGYTVGDLDADGSLELVVDHNQTTLAIYRVGASGPASLLMKLAMPRGVQARDVDGDGDLDLVSMHAGFVGVANNLTFD